MKTTQKPCSLNCGAPRNGLSLSETARATTLLPLLLLLALPAAVPGQDYTYTTNNGTITLIAYTGSGGAVTIPDVLDGLPVTTIGDHAFYGCASLASVTISTNVSSLGDRAFSGCFNLTRVTMPDNITNIGVEAFYYCGSLTRITIPNRVTAIASATFFYCSSLTSVLIGDSVTTIGDWAFTYCASLTNVTMGNGLTSIGSEAFGACNALTSVTIPQGVTHFGDHAFASCPSLTAVYFQGNAPASGFFLFDGDSQATIYYLPGATGWSSTFQGRPTAPFPLALTAAPHSQQTWIGGNATFSVSVQSAWPVTCQWRFNGVDLPGETNATLLLLGVTTNQFGHYSVAVSNAFGGVISSEAQLSLVPPNTILLEEFSAACIGNAYGITYAPALDGLGAVFWRTNESRIEYPMGPLMPTQGTLEWWIKVDRGYHYYAGMLYTNDTQATFFTTGYQDVAWPGNACFNLGSNGDIVVSMSTSKGGVTPAQDVVAPGIWFRFGEWHAVGVSFGSQGQHLMLDGQLVASMTTNTQVLGTGGAHDVPCDVPTLGAMQSCFFSNNQYEGGFEGMVDRFRISSAQQDWVLAAAPAGSAATNPPTIFRQPQDQTRIAGDSVTFDVQAYGAWPLTYQWQFNGTNMPVATNQILALASVSPAAAGDYRLIAANAYGSVTSAVARLTVVPLTITAQPQNLQVWAGGTATFGVSVQSALPVTYQWRFNGADLPGGTNATLIVASVATNQFGNYSVTVSNAFGAVVSLDAVLTEVFVDLSSGLVAYYPFDGDATDASGRGHDAEPHGGVQYAPGQFGLAVALDGVDDFLSTAASADFALSRNFTAAFWCKPEAGSSGFILWNGPDGCADFGYPQTWMAMWGGGNFRFEKCGFAGRWIVGPDMPGGEWTHVAMVVRDDGDAGYLYVNGVMVGSSGAGAPFAVPPTSFVMGRRGPVSAEYYRGLLDEVRVYSRALSDAEVQALYLYESPPIKVPLITHQPSNQSVFVGSSAAFSVTALGADPITYQWLKGGSPIPEATNAILALTNVQPAEVGSYSVLLSNAFGSVTSAPAILRVSTNFSFNVAADFSTNANPNGAWSYGWSPRGSSGFNLFESSGIHPSGGWAMWYMPRPSFLPFVAFNASDNLIAWQTLSIEPHALFLHPGDASENSIVRWTAPASGTVLIDATFKGGDKGGGTTTDVHVLAPNGQSLFDAAVNGFGAASAANWDGSIQVSAGETINFVVGDGGNGYGCDSTVLDATVTLFQTNGPPVIIRQPTNQCVVAGSSVTLSVSAVGAGALTYQWQFNGTDISPATNQILALANVHSTNAGDYRLIVANAYGSVTSAVARLTVVPLIILTQPQSQQVWAGDSATFSVQAYGNSPLSYEWRFNGANIANATNSTLTLANTRLSDTGDYTVVLWNSSGSVTSAVARLTVSPAVPLDHWSSRNSGKSDDLFAITYGNGLFVVVGDEGTILASTNGLNWTDHSVFDGYYLNGVTYGNGLYVAVGDFGGILTSPDAESWTDRSGEVTLADLRDVAYGNGVYVVIGRGGTILISADADTWETIVPDPNRDLNAITFENGIFVVVGQRNGGLILISTNGATWTDASPGTAPNLRGVGAGPDSVVVAGNGGTVLTSTTNSTWAETTVLCPIGRPVNLRACTYGSGAYVVVGNGGAILSSETATNWTCRSSGTTANLHSIAFGQGTYVAVGSDGTILQAAASQPRLSVSCSGTHLELRWPSVLTGYVLESASSLSRSAVWSPVTNQVTVAGSDCITSHGMDSPARFYRLRSP